jgi:hypothetical protein
MNRLSVSLRYLQFATLRSVVLLGIVLLVPTLASASPITLSYVGTVTQSDVPLLPVGTPVSFDWTIDPTASDSCANPAQGIFIGSSTTLRVAGLTYVTPSDEFLINANDPGGCNGNPSWTELRAITWSGPDLPGFQLMQGTLFGGVPAQIFQLLPQPSDNLATFLQSSAVTNLFVVGPYFNNDFSTHIGASVSLVPEPASLLLLGTGLAAVAVRRRFTSST